MGIFTFHNVIAEHRRVKKMVVNKFSGFEKNFEHSDTNFCCVLALQTEITLDNTLVVKYTQASWPSLWRSRWKRRAPWRKAAWRRRWKRRSERPCEWSTHVSALECSQLWLAECAEMCPKPPQKRPDTGSQGSPMTKLSFCAGKFACRTRVWFRATCKYGNVARATRYALPDVWT